MYSVYCIDFPNGKVYIGKTKDLTVRVKRHLSDAKAGKKRPVHCAIRKYNIDKNMFTLLINVSTEVEAFEYERYMISLAQSNKRNIGYSLTVGGEGTEGYVPTLLTRQKLRIAITGKRLGSNHPQWGKKLSSEARQKLNLSHAGKRPPNAHIKYIQKLRMRAVTRSDGMIFESGSAAARFMGLSQSSINDHMNGRSKTCGGFTFKYL